ncbi:hypothetical protein R1flu_026779 [Riccia fluitans]|uniref:Uncharacterized protein n=1 Tax=Riccia fluitans TaxID=41844 RepID=A0ABD1XJT8_9MARC
MGNVALVSCCLSSVVRVVHPSGKVYIYTEPISIAELLQSHPHHYVRDSRDGLNPNGKMLPLDVELELGHTYLLVPLPRLFSHINIGKQFQTSSSLVCPGGLSSQAGRGNLGSSNSEDVEARTFRRRTKGRVTLRSLLALETGCAAFIRRSLQGSQEAGKSSSTAQLHRILENAENHWKSRCPGHKSWRPELESIKEEARKSASSSPLHELALAEHHQRLLICTNSVDSFVKPNIESVQR